MELHTCFVRPGSQLLPRAMLVRGGHKPWAVACRGRCTMAMQQASSDVTARRSANFQPNVWDYDAVQSLKSGSLVETDAQQTERLMKEVKHLIYKEDELVARLELLDDVQRLGLGYHFDKEIKDVLGSLSNNGATVPVKEDLYATALMFRLLREHGFPTSQDVFDAFKDETGNFKAMFHSDIQAILSLYEASHLAFEGETKLDEARDFASKILNDLMPQLSPQLKQKVAYALEFPSHWRTIRVEARRYIEEYEVAANKKPALLQLAKLDFNLVQSIHQKELQKMIRWWKELDLKDALSFARDRLMECFMFATGIVFEPHLGAAREEITKAFKLITVIDDVYDVYASLDELELFTSAVNRWDINAIEELPDYMKTCYSGLYNTVKEIADRIMEQEKWDALPYLRKVWTDLLNAFLMEAKWSQSSQVPSLKEYLNNARISVSGHVLLLHALILSGERPSKEALACYENYHDLILSSSTIFRLTNDLATSSAELERGDVATSIQCYMNDNGVSEAAAREGVKQLIIDAWKKVNKEAVDSSPLPQSFAQAAINLGRISHCTYQGGDGHGAPDEEKKKQVQSLFFEPIPLEEGSRFQEMARMVY